MNGYKHLIRILDIWIHKVPMLPCRLQDTWIDRIWEKISSKKKGEIDGGV